MTKSLSPNDPVWDVRAVKTVEFEAIRDFVSISFDGDEALYKFREGRLWKSACFIRVWDDGRVRLVVEKHLTPRQLKIVAGLAEEYWRGGPKQCKHENWHHRRRSSKRPVGSWVSQFWVTADSDERGYAEAHADYELVVASDLNSLVPASSLHHGDTNLVEVV